MKFSEPLKGAFYVLLGAVCFSTSGVFQAMAPDGATPFVICECRMIVGTLSLFLWCVLTGKLPKLKSDFRCRPFVVCALWIMFAQVFYFLGMQKLGMAVGIVVDIGITPIAAAVFALAVLKKMPTRLWLVATSISLVGIVLINSISGENNVDPLYIIFPVLGGSAYAGYLTFNSYLPKDMAPEASIMIVMAFVSLFLSPVLFFFPTQWVLGSMEGLGVCLGLGVITAGVAFSLTLAGVRRTSPVVASSLGLAEPMVGACLGIFLLREPVSFYSTVGMLLVLFSIVLLIFGEAKK